MLALGLISEEEVVEAIEKATTEKKVPHASS
ncbi:hypothetical protein IFM89_031138, partial [Coptis chinensis]